MTGSPCLRMCAALLAAMLVAGCARGAERAQEPTPPAAEVAVLRCDPSLHYAGWVGEWEHRTCVDVLRRLGFSVREIPDAALRSGPWDFKVLVLANNRCMSREEVAAVREFHRQGGHVLATYLASYRDEKNQSVGPGNHFQLADVLGCDVYRWTSGGGACARLGALELGRNSAMLVRPAEGSQVLARWTNADGKSPVYDAGVVLSADGRVLYVGENLFAPDNSRSGEVRRYLASLLERWPLERHPAAGWDRTDLDFSIPYPQDAPVPPASGPPVRVGLDVVPDMWVTSPGGLRLLPGPRATLEAWVGTGWRPSSSASMTAGELWEARGVATLLKQPYVTFYSREMRLKVRCRGPVRIEPAAGGYVLAVALRGNGTGTARGYRGALELWPSAAGGLRPINVLPLESYVAGVVANEMPPLFPSGAIDAMSVIARTFVLSHLHRHESEGFDVCPSVHCQVYGGMLSEWTTGNAATTRTVGDIVTWQGRPADTTFHAACGGVGERVENVWNQPPTPYLEGYVDGPAAHLPDLSSEEEFRRFIDNPPESFCGRSPRFRWTEAYPAAELDLLFRQSLPVTLRGDYRDIGSVRDLRVLSRSRNGRVQEVEIVGTRGSCRVARDAIRWLWSGGAIGTGGLQSTLFYVERDPHADPPVFKIHGGGWGHGVGMCQEGAGGMADRGMDFRAIILHYYPGVAISRLPE